MPFFSPLWYRGPRIVFLHHVHAEMWRMVLPGWIARMGELIEKRVAPPIYRDSRIVTLSNSSHDEIVEQLGIPAGHVSVTARASNPVSRRGAFAPSRRWWSPWVGSSR